MLVLSLAYFRIVQIEGLEIEVLLNLNMLGIALPSGTVRRI